MEFKPLYFGDQLHIINPRGVIGVVTLWSRPEYVMARFREAGVDLDPATSPIAVFGTLYGNGLREMLRNLLFNPQIQVLLICGHDRSGSAHELHSFFDGFLEAIDSPLVLYKNPPGIDAISILRISDTNRLLDDLVRPEKFIFYPDLPQIVPFVDPQKAEFIDNLKKFFGGFINNPRPVAEADRLKIPLPEVEVQYFPSNPRAHQIVKDTPLEAWNELLFTITRFGRRVTLRKGDRLELQNVKVVVEKPEFESKAKLQAFNLDHEKLKRYQEDILRIEFWEENISVKGQMTLPLPNDIPRVELRPDESYNYGHRLRQYFGMDGLVACVLRLLRDPEDRKAYFTLWHNQDDLNPEKAKGHPCFVSLFFRKFEKKLTMTATFRTHNALDGWILNCYGLMAIQNWVGEKVNLPNGPITVISHSISIDPKELDRALTVVGKRKWKMRLDPMGYFRVTLDGQEILVEHRFEDVTLKEYRGRTAVAVQHQVARDLAVSDINHAMYLGRQLAQAELALKEGREFIQD